MASVGMLGHTPAANAASLPQRYAKSLDSLLNAGLRRGYYPGVSVVIGTRAGVVYEKCLGYHDSTRTATVKPTDLYDLASVTKVAATTLAVMKLYDDRLIDLNKTVGDYIRTYDGSEVAGIPVAQLLTHTSGLPWFPIYPMLFHNSCEGETLIKSKPADGYPLRVDKNAYLCADPVEDPEYVSRVPVEGWRRAGEAIYVNPAIDGVITEKIKSSYRENLRGKYRYSDTNFHILRQIVERVTGERLDDYVRPMHRRMEMARTTYRPLESFSGGEVIPTEHDHLMQRGLICGYPHDEWAAVSYMAVNGHAGLFSTASDMSKFCEMLLREGVYDGDRIISKETVRLFTSSPLAPKNIYRGLGFDKRDPESALGSGYGHTGYTGTMIWLDPSREVFMVFLSNRVFPTRLNNGLAESSLRTQVWEVVKKAADRGDL